MNVLIIGASSFIGSYQVEMLLNDPEFVGGG
jgi:nucleoside-diphosphate-sugar epimerase